MRHDIADYALIGDLHTAALVSPEGSIDWLCLPRFDSPAMCAAVLGESHHGQWTLAPAGGGRCTRRRYRTGTLVLETDWVIAGSAVRVIDFMAIGSSPGRVVRIVQGLAGEVSMHLTLNPSMQYGQRPPAVRNLGRHVCLSSGAEAVWLHSDVDLTTLEGGCGARFRVAAGETYSFTLTTAAPTAPGQGRQALGWCSSTERFWTDWIDRCTYEGPWAEQVRESLILLKSLTCAGTGAIVAAATTSLPERVGGSRNWDYRFCWLRDAAFAVEAFLLAGYIEEAAAWRDWLITASADGLDDIPVMYSVDGGPCPPEQILDWLPGHGNSAPVRIGNEAANQDQNDVWGEVLSTLGSIRAAGVPPAPGQERLEAALLTRLRRQWSLRDHGLWEVRGPQRHFVHSKVMCWAGVDQAIRNLEADPTPQLPALGELRDLRATIHDDICSRGFDAARASFTQAYGSPRLDAALLLLPRYGFLPWDDPRVAGTVEAIRTELTSDGLVSRYAVGDGAQNLDGVPGGEGAFIACSFWLVDALHELGHTGEAVEQLDRLLSLRNDVGLLSEEYDRESKMHVGNTPQAFSHAGVVTSAIRLGRATSGAGRLSLPAPVMAVS